MGQGVAAGVVRPRGTRSLDPRRLGSIGAHGVRYPLEGTGLIDPDGNTSRIDPTSVGVH